MLHHAVLQVAYLELELRADFGGELSEIYRVVVVLIQLIFTQLYVADQGPLGSLREKADVLELKLLELGPINSSVLYHGAAETGFEDTAHY